MINKIFRTIRKLTHNSKGQSATEYMLILAVVVLALVAAASRLIQPFQEGVKKLGDNVVKTLETPQKMSGAQ